MANDTPVGRTGDVREGTARLSVDKPDLIVDHIPNRCEGCEGGVGGPARN